MDGSNSPARIAAIVPIPNKIDSFQVLYLKNLKIETVDDDIGLITIF